MNRQELGQNTYPLSATRLKEMQDDYSGIAAAVAGLKDPENASESKFILSGCVQRGDAGFAVWDGELMEVEADADPSKVNLDIHEENVYAAVNGAQVHVRTVRRLRYTASSTPTSMLWMTMRRATISLARPDAALTIFLSSAWSAALSAEISSGHLMLTFSGSITSLHAVTEDNFFRLSAPFLPSRDICVPCLYREYSVYGASGAMLAGSIVLGADGYLRLPIRPHLGDSYAINAKVRLV